MGNNFNYGQEANQHRCGDGCGMHAGVGNWTAEDRAAIYARTRDKLPALHNGQQQEYLNTWEQMHGLVRYEMQPVGTYSKDHEKAGQTLYGARMSGFTKPRSREAMDWRAEA